MANRLVIDTFNVLHVTGVLPPELAGPDAVQLAGLIRLSRWARTDVRLVCDGGGGRLVLPKELAKGSEIRLVFAGHGPDAADIMIEGIINADSAPRSLLVVSSDHRVLAAARKRRCSVLTSEQFLGRLADDASVHHQSPDAGETPGTVDPKTLTMWMRLFGFEPSEGAKRRAEAPPPVEVDPLDAELGSMGIDSDDLDMGKWVDGVERED